MREESKMTVFGEIPDGWKIEILENLGTTYSGLSGKSKEDFGTGQPYITYMNVFSNTKINTELFDYVAISSSEKQNKVNYGDILFTISSETVNEVGMSAVMLEEFDDLYLNSFCFGFRLKSFKDLLPDFARYLFRGEEVRKIIAVLSQGSTRFNLSKNSFVKKVYIKLPPLPEQQKIATILSTVDEKIDIIDAQITQTRELKKGLMQKLLTRGIGHTKFQDSVLGEIPESWMVDLLDNQTKRVSGHTPNKAFANYYNGGIKWVSLADSSSLDKGWIFNTKNEISLEGVKNSSAVIHPKGTVLMSRDAGVGKSAVMGENMAVSQHFIAWICCEKLNNWFLYYWLQVKKEYFERIAVGSTIKTIGLPIFKKLQIPVPPITEQNEIATILQTIDEKIDVLKSKKESYQELKKGLMQQLLTGKVRVFQPELEIA